MFSISVLLHSLACLYAGTNELLSFDWITVGDVILT